MIKDAIQPQNIIHYIFRNIFAAFSETRRYFSPRVLYCLERIYAAYTPFLLTRHVPFVQIGNDLPLPKKQREPHLRRMTVF